MRRLHTLTDRTVKTTLPGKHHDGGGLYLVAVDGRGGITRSWSFRYSIGNGKTRYLGLGAYPLVTLAQARQAAADARALIAQGTDPIARKRAVRASLSQPAPKTVTFADAASAYIASHEASWRGPRHHQMWVNSLARHAHLLSDLPVDAITTEHVLKVLQPIWVAKNETAAQVRGRLEAILDYAKVLGQRSGENPARWRAHLDHLLPARNKVAPVEHHRALPYHDMPEFLASLRKRDASAARALEFTILTATRTGEVLGANWSEIDLDTRTWVIP